MLTFPIIKSILSNVDYKDWHFHVAALGDAFYLQVQFLAPDNDDPRKAEVQHGRKWYISCHMTKSELVQTAFSAVKFAEEHEMRELFKYKGQRVFGPHFDIEGLVEFAAQDKLDKRV